MSEYTKYRGQCIGRLIGCIEQYCGLQVADSAQYGDGKITFYRQPFATYKWLDQSDIPIFEFVCKKESGWLDPEYYHKIQFIMRPFLDDHFMAESVRYIVQEVANNMSFQDAKMIKWSLDKWHNEIDRVTGDLKNRILPTIPYQDYSYFREQHLEYWWHFAVCAVYEILTPEERNNYLFPKQCEYDYRKDVFGNKEQTKLCNSTT